MKPRLMIFVLACLLLLSGCGTAETTEPTPPATMTPTPSPIPAPTPTPEPTEEVKELWSFPIDDTHNAFEVPTGGRLGTVLVTEEREEKAEDNGVAVTLSVWAKDDVKTPIQTFEAEGDLVGVFGEIEDYNFDGYTDFCYSYYCGAANANFGLYLWEEEQGQFILTEKYFGTGLWADKETQTIHNYVHGSAMCGTHEIYRWEGDELLRVREVTYLDPDLEHDTRDLLVYDRINGELTEVYRESFSWGEEGDNPDYSSTAEKWLDLSYHGET